MELVPPLSAERRLLLLFESLLMLKEEILLFGSLLLLKEEIFAVCSHIAHSLRSHVSEWPEKTSMFVFIGTVV